MRRWRWAGHSTLALTLVLCGDGCSRHTSGAEDSSTSEATSEGAGTDTGPGESDSGESDSGEDSTGSPDLGSGPPGSSCEGHRNGLESGDEAGCGDGEVAAGTYCFECTRLTDGVGKWVFADDFDSDGAADVVVVGNEVSVFAGDGNGGLEAPLVTPLGDTYRDVAAGDFDGDGDPDLLFARSYGGFIELRPNDGGDFSEAIEVDLGFIPECERIETLDLDADGWADFSCSGAFLGWGSIWVSTLRLWRNEDGGTSFTNAHMTVPGKGDGCFPVDEAIADFDGDGRQDFADVLGCVDLEDNPVPGGLRLVLGDQVPPQLELHAELPTGTEPAAVAVGAWNDDAELDLLVALPELGHLAAYKGYGDGSFAEPIDVLVDGCGGCSGPLSAELVDLDGDGGQDLLYRQRDGDNDFLTVLLASSTMVEDRKRVGMSAFDPAYADLNGDGIADLVYVSTEDENRVATVLVSNP